MPYPSMEGPGRAQGRRESCVRGIRAAGDLVPSIPANVLTSGGPLPAVGLYSGTVSRRISVKRPARDAWRALSDITGMAGWADGVSSCTALGGPRRGVGARRVVRFEDGPAIEEHFTEWRPFSYTYAAVSGLDLRAYVATISVEPARGSCLVRWRSYMASCSTTRARFEASRSAMGSFYSRSLRSFAAMLEGRD